MSKDKADYQDADLALRVYELRREPVMRESRKAITFQFWPKAFEDVQALTKADHPLNAAYRQVASFWEMVYGFVKHGIVNPDFFLESNGEGLFLFAKIHPFLDQLRKATSPFAYGNAEWVTKETAKGRQMWEIIQARVKKLAEAR
jgi:hypothetical protein